MRKSTIIIAYLLFYAAQTNAQVKNEKEYREHSKEVAAGIWGTKTIAFAVTKVPDEYDKESAVIIAKSVNVVNTAKKKREFWGGDVKDKLTYDNTVHIRVKINDKAALNEFSSIEYEKQLVRNSRSGWTKKYNQQYTFIGAKVIKPNGQETVVNGDEEVLTINEDKTKEGKLAISDLQVGDILDYYVSEEIVTEMGDEIQGPYTYFLNSDYPIMLFKLHMELDERAGAIYVNANGAPKPIVSKNDNGPVVDLELKNISKTNDTRWTLPMRQLPYVSIEYQVLFNREADKSSDFNRGEVNQAEGWETFFKKLKNQYVRAFNANMMAPAPSYWNNAREFFGGKKELRNTPADSLIKILYNLMLRSASSQAEDLDELPEKIDNMSIFNFSIALDRSELPHDFLFVTPRNGPSKNNVLIGGNRLVPLLHIKANKDIWVDFERTTFFSNKLPSWLEGEDAEGFSVKEGWKDVSYKLPVSSASDNVIAEKMDVSLGSNMQALQINRKTTLTGNYIQGTMNDLETLEGYKNSLNAVINDKKWANVDTSLSMANEKQKSEFKNEIDSWFDHEPKELNNCVVNALTTDAFSYSSSFTMDDWVKKAGNNYIVELGRLIGGVNKLDENERKRTLDIYMPFARTIESNYTVTVPAGYSVKGLENFTKNIKNETGEFSGTATVTGDKINFIVKRIFVKSNQPLSNWPKILELMDAAFDYSQQKLLFEKNK